MLVLSRAYPNNVFETLGLWVHRPTRVLAQLCDVRVISPIPWCPPLPSVGPLRQYTRFRTVLREEARDGVSTLHPRFLVGPGQSLLATEAWSYRRGIASTVRRLHRTFPFDLIHAYFIYPDGVVASELAEEYDVPFVVTEQAPWLDERYARPSALDAAREAAAVLTVSSSARASIVQYTNQPDSVRVIPNGVDAMEFPLGPQTGRRPGQILFAGVQTFTKGIDVLLHAFRTVSERVPSARLILVGGWHYRHTRLQGERLQALAANLELGDRVSFVGHQPPDVVARYMRESAVFVLPSRAESFGTVLVEALASGTPVVATRCGGPEDIVTDDVGRLVPTEDPAALADALCDVLAEPERYDPARLRAFALSRFGWDAIAKDVLAAYEDALS